MTRPRLTSMELAAQAGVSFGVISRAENGRPIRRATLARLAAAPIRQPQRTDPLYLKQLASFPTWLLAQQHRPDPIGAIARVADGDPDFRRLAAQGDPTRRPAAPDLREAWTAWRRWRRRHLRHHARPYSLMWKAQVDGRSHAARHAHDLCERPL